MLGRFFTAAFATALCMSISLGFAMPRTRWAELRAGDWLTGLLVIGGTATLVGLVAAVCVLFSARSRRTRYLRKGGSKKDFDPLDVIPFI